MNIKIMGSTSTLKFVIIELEKTVREAQGSFNAFLAAMDQLSLLESTVNAVNQMRGIFIVLEDKGAELYCEELGKLLNEYPIPEDQLQSDKGQRMGNTVVVSLAFMSRYLEFVEVAVKTYPETLILEINLIRKARGISLYQDSHFYQYAVPHLKKPKSSVDFRWDESQALELGRYRKIYQNALLELVRGVPMKPALQNMRFAMIKVDHLAANTAMAPLFWLASMALHALLQQEASIHTNRLVLFFKLDRQLKRLLDLGAPGFALRPQKDLAKELLYILALCQNSAPVIQRVVSWYGMPAPTVTEAILIEQRSILTSPGHSVLQTVSVAIKEELLVIQAQIDTAGFSEPDNDFSAHKLHQGLRKITAILKVIGLSSASNVLSQQVGIVSEWPDRTVPTSRQLNEIADAVMYVESAVNRLVMGHAQSTGNDVLLGINQAQLQAARMVLLDESENGVTLCRRAITAFIESDFDHAQLGAVLPTLDSVRGGLIFLEFPEAEMVIERCMIFVEKRLLSGSDSINHKMLEHLADALSRIEMYLDDLQSGSRHGDGLLEGAITAAEHLPRV